MMENTERPPKLLKPSDALNRFVPTEQLGSAWSEQEIEQVRYGFYTGNVGLIADLDKGSEIITEFKLCAIPNTPPWFSGVINLRGNLVPVFNLAILFKAETGLSKKKYLIVIGEGDQAAGVLIDKLPTILRSADISSEMPTLPAALSSHVHTAYIQDKDIWLEFDAESFFTEIGKQIVNKM